MVEERLKRFGLRAARGVWWILTPWRARERLAYLRRRAEGQRNKTELEDLAEFELARRALAARGSGGDGGIDLLDAARLARELRVPVADLSLPAASPGAVVDRRTAASFVIGAWHADRQLRLRFPTLFLNGRDFLLWLRADGRQALGLTDASLAHVEALFSADFAGRARQAFMAHAEVRSVLPHGLTPPGMASLLRWFLRAGMRSAGIPAEEVWWLFLQASQDPARELLLAHAFTPEWQRLHPEGATVFGRARFAQWFGREYAVEAAWLDSSTWPQWLAPEEQLRIAYWAREPWRNAHPAAFASQSNAAAFVEWLASPHSGLDSGLADWCRAQAAPELAVSLARPGFNVIGHFTYPSGLRVSVESLVQGSRLAGIDVALRDMRTDAKDDPHHVDFRGTEIHDVTVIHTQPEPYFDEVFNRADLQPRAAAPYRIAYWYWEFDSVPESWKKQAAKVDEVWAATEFVAKGLRERLQLPVRTLFPGVKLAPYQRRPREYFGLEGGSYTFLFTFHMMSVMERKNPLGLIKAFQMAFRPEEPVSLVLKTSFGDRHPEQIEELRKAAQGSNIRIIDVVYSPDEVLSLMDCCDAYISLHRSEGLGLTMAEAMLMGKPVIATGYSGNVDFMDESNSVLIPYTLKKLGRPIPPYDADSEWAEPSIEQAAKAMRKVFDDPSWARELGARAQTSALERLSLETAGRKVSQRLAEIRAQRAAEP